jgi:pyruvate/2-oxoglutarate dehydrogenase complex dihydrolipoamide dehydrogenase (E3) component
VCEALNDLLKDEGIDVHLNARIKRVSGKSGDSVSVVVEQNGIEKVLKGSHVLVATGRTPNTEGFGLELTGVELTDRGYIKVNERLQTTAPGVWAIGEVAGSPQFTAHQHRRFPRSPCQFSRRQPCDHGQASSILSVYGS